MRQVLILFVSALIAIGCSVPPAPKYVLYGTVTAVEHTDRETRVTFITDNKELITLTFLAGHNEFWPKEHLRLEYSCPTYCSYYYEIDSVKQIQ